MTDLRQAALMALEAYEAWDADSVSAYYKLKALGPALRAALEQPQAATEDGWLEVGRLLKTVKYLRGMAERGTGRQMRDDETVEQFILGYVQSLEQPQAEPVAWLVCSVNKDGALSVEYAAAWQEAAHEHINDAITEHGIEDAASWVVRPVYLAAPAQAEPQGEREAMDDEWLVSALQRALIVSGCKPDDPAANVLRGFANRVLQQFGDAEGVREALNVAYTNRQAEQSDTERDAARYRWLASHCRSTAEHWGGRWSIVVEGPAPENHTCEDAFDAAIDAAMKGEPQAEPRAVIDRRALANDIKDAINELAKGRRFPDLMAAIDALAVAPAQADPQDVLDAARYRWLREQHEVNDDDASHYNYGRSYPKRTMTVWQDDGEDGLEPIPCDPGALDEAIDAAMKDKP